MKAIKLSIIAVAMTAAGFGTASAQSGDEIIIKHNEAMGGTKNWDKIKSMKMIGSMSIQGMDIPFTQTVVNSKGMRMDFNAMGMSNYMIVTPKGGWMYMPAQGQSKIDTLPAAQLSQYASKLNIKDGQIINIAEMKKIEYLGKDTINSVPCYKVLVIDKDGNEKTDYIEIGSYYLVRQEAKMKGPDDAEMEVSTNFSDFQKQAEGVVVPMFVSAQQQDIKFKSVEINKPVDDKIFVATMPAAPGK